jgi:hypothetical protein
VGDHFAPSGGGFPTRAAGHVQGPGSGLDTASATAEYAS